jgi:hypothetical protein
VLEGARKFTFPEGLVETNTDAVMLCVPVPLVSYFRRFFAQMESPYVWKTQADYLRAYPVFAETEAQMAAAPCASSIVDAIDRLYRLTDTSLNGTQYEDVAGVITPALPAVPPASTSAPNAMRAHIGRLWHLVENTTTGETYPAGAGIDGSADLPDSQTLRAALRRLIAGIDGNTDPAPGDSILMALRGTNETGAARNVIDSNSERAVYLVEQLGALLVEIRDKLV